MIMIVRAALCTLQTFTGAVKLCLCSVVGTCVVVEHLLEQRTEYSSFGAIRVQAIIASYSNSTRQKPWRIIDILMTKLER